MALKTILRDQSLFARKQGEQRDNRETGIIINILLYQCRSVTERGPWKPRSSGHSSKFRNIAYKFVHPEPFKNQMFRCRKANTSAAVTRGRLQDRGHTFNRVFHLNDLILYTSLNTQFRNCKRHFPLTPFTSVPDIYIGYLLIS